MDLYHIPQDDGKGYRLKKFVEYQHEVPSAHYRFAVEYAKRNDLSRDDIVQLAFLLATTYNEITSIFLFEAGKKQNLRDVWEKYENVLKFNSARKHMKFNNRFEILLAEWNAETDDKPYGKIKQLESENACVTYKRIYNWYKAFSENGRMASDFFLEVIVYAKDLLKINVKEPDERNWDECANLTSGLFNIFYEDERAKKFEATKKLTQQEKEYLTKKLIVVQKEIQKQYPEQESEITKFIGKICSFRNLFKGTRYGGYHHDRQLETIIHYQTTVPEYKTLWEQCYEIRKDIYQHRFLGELNGWNGIRKERKRMWLEQGKTGVEK